MSLSVRSQTFLILQSLDCEVRQEVCGVQFEPSVACRLDQGELVLGLD